MTSIRDLYIQLGFYPADLQGEILHPVTRLPRLAHTRHCDAWLRGGLDSLLEHMNDFVEEHVEAKYNDTWLFKDGVHERRFSRRTSIADVVRVTQIFLKQDRRADFFWGNGWGEHKRPYQGPSWPRDKELIEDLLSHLFLHIIRCLGPVNGGQAETTPETEDERSPKPLEDSTDDDESVGLEDDESFGLEDETNDHKRVQEQASSPFEIQVPPVISALLFPIEEELITHLQAWRKVHGRLPPGATRYHQQTLASCKPKQVTTMEGLAEVTRFKIDDECMGWKLRKPDGKLMLVVPRPGGTGVVRYRAWLGEHLGFTEEFIATSYAPSSLLAKQQSVQVQIPARYAQKPAASDDSDTSDGPLDPRVRSKRRLIQGKRSEARGSGKKARVTVAKDLPRAAPSQAPEISHASLISQESTTTEYATSGETSSSAPHRPAASASGIGFHFFLSDPALGAIHKLASDCSTAELFFEAALASFKITCYQGEELKIAAVGVSWKGAIWPVVIRWKDAEGFGRMVSTVGRMAAASTSASQDFEVEVRCILQR